MIITPYKKPLGVVIYSSANIGLIISIKGGQVGVGAGEHIKQQQTFSGGECELDVDFGD